ncbi:UNVERIFIED_CONTAM: hypothetical protein GTU68_031094 [Idotea baltica]|nr:hypothetical protein [Idotea baltica]
MTIRLGDTAPDFTAETTQGTVTFHDWKKDSWAVLFSHPKDFTPVCTTELGTVAKLKAVRSVFVIGPDNTVKLSITYPASTGRNFDEILRVIDSLQLTAKHSVATPANWTDGNEVIIGAGLSDEDAKEKFPEGWRADRPYLRWVPQPK